MRLLNEWLVHRKDMLALFCSVFFSVVLLLSNNTRQVHTIRSWTFAGFGYLLDKVEAVGKYHGLVEENQWLRQETATLMLQNSQLREAQVENRRLRALLDFKEKSALVLVPAKVLGKDESGFVNAIFLAAGSADSLKKNMAVVTSQGLVGKVYQVGKRNSTAQLLLDRNFRAGAVVQRSRVAGIVKWNAGNQVVLAEVPKRSDVQEGDVIVTSSLSTIFPSGLEIGRVVEVSEENQGMFMDIQVGPAVDFGKLEEVFVVKVLALQEN